MANPTDETTVGGLTVRGWQVHIGTEIVHVTPKHVRGLPAEKGLLELIAAARQQGAEEALEKAAKECDKIAIWHIGARSGESKKQRFASDHRARGASDCADAIKELKL